jgi:polyisoprenoid-binding protein YceI
VQSIEIIMKNRSLISLTVCLFFSAAVFSQTPFKVTESEMTIYGTSTLHDWHSDVTEMTASGKILMENGKLKSIPSLTVEVPAESIKSTKGSIMDRKTYSALKSDNHPTITFQLSSVQSITDNSTGVKIAANGYLTMAGTKKWITLNVDGIYENSNTIRFEGSKTLNMTDYDMEPPKALAGTIKTGEEVTVKFSLTVATEKMTAQK